MDLELNYLLGNSTSGGGQLLGLDKLLASLMPFIVLISLVSIVIMALYVVNMVNTYRSHRATIEMRDILREMNQRDKARDKQPTDYTDAGASTNRLASSKDSPSIATLPSRTSLTD